MSLKLQTILVFVILGLLLIYIIYNLVRKKDRRFSNCAGCSLAESCSKKNMMEQKGELPKSCNDCPETDGCEKKGTFQDCGSSEQ